MPALPGWKYEFPRDHFSHADFRTEWWYYTGNLDSRGRHFGFELTFFRQAVSEKPSSASVWGTRDIWMAHLALTDTAGQQFFHAERLNRSGPGLAGVDAQKKKIWNGNWRCELRPDQHTLVGTDPRFRFQLQLRPTKAPVIHGQGGVSQKGPKPGQASLYVSFPRLAAAGKVAVGGEEFAVTGTAWMDHEVFSSELDPQLAGWDWFSIQLEDNTELMLYRLRQKDGTASSFSAGSFIDAAGKVLHLSASDFRLKPGRRWKDYPVEWEVEVPQLGLALRARPRLDAQELRSGTGLTPSYWEGAMLFEGTRVFEGAKGLEGAKKGVGYLEMTGYDKALRFLDAPETSQSGRQSASGYEKLGLK
ncbi:MAG: lipocalin-like domain-containing protein [Bryobacter sp.]|nr:lipocalin-like domain-containing protein [Bryobacter sp.]